MYYPYRNYMIYRYRDCDSRIGTTANLNEMKDGDVCEIVRTSDDARIGHVTVSVERARGRRYRLSQDGRTLACCDSIKTLFETAVVYR